MIDYNSLKNKSVCLLLSGGVDSAVSLYELIAHDIIPDCYYIKIGPKQQAGYDCNSDEDIEVCTWLTNHFKCNFKIIDLHKEYWNNVTKYTMDKVRVGLTPNPDVMCNTLIKFGAFYDKIGHGYDYIATGHYAQTKIVDGQTVMCTSPDPVKDQTDFLCNLDKKLIKHILFPIGHMPKTEIRRIADEQHLVNRFRKDSQGICFLGKINYNDYIRKFLGTKEGNIVEYETNNVLGTHEGHWFFTIGQRKGLFLSGGPWYCVKKDIDKNIVYVSRDKDLMNYTTNIIKMNSINVLCDSLKDPKIESTIIEFKFRHTPDHYHGILFYDNQDNCYKVLTKASLNGIAPGQFCVIYDENFDVVLASGEITL